MAGIEDAVDHAGIEGPTVEGPNHLPALENLPELHALLPAELQFPGRLRLLKRKSGRLNRAIRDFPDGRVAPVTCFGLYRLRSTKSALGPIFSIPVFNYALFNPPPFA